MARIGAILGGELIVRYLPIMACFLVSCASFQASSERSPDENSVLLKGFSNFCAGRLEIADLDRGLTATRLRTTPGEHRMRIVYRGRPFISDSVPGSFFAECVVISEHEVSFLSKSEKTYWFYVDEVSEREHALSVWESLYDVGPEGARIPATTTQLSITKRCYIDDRFHECLR